MGAALIYLTWQARGSSWSQDLRPSVLQPQHLNSAHPYELGRGPPLQAGNSLTDAFIEVL